MGDDVNTLQAWLLVGIPALVLAAGLFAARSMIRAAAGYVVLAATFVFFLLVPNSTVSAAVVGTIGFLLVAQGRGQTLVEAEAAGDEIPFRVDDPNVEEPRRI